MKRTVLRTSAIFLLFFTITSSFVKANIITENSPVKIDDANKKNLFNEHAQKLFNELSVDGLDYLLFRDALKGYYLMLNKGTVANKEILSIIDFRKPSSEKRLFVINLKRKEVVYNELVAHGKNTGNLYAEDFSNRPNSNQSSRGFYLTNETYNGKKGYSLKLDGQEPAFNSKARQRGVIIHGAKYVSESFVKKHNRLGRSFGCPSLRMDVCEELIDCVKGKSVLFIYHPGEDYLQKSEFLNGTEYLDAYFSVLEKSA